MADETPVVAESYHPVEGVATISITPTGEYQPWDMPADVDLTLEDVVLEHNEDDYQVEMDYFHVSAVSVGWFPG
jgi:hypothetical protein